MTAPSGFARGRWPLHPSGYRIARANPDLIPAYQRALDQWFATWLLVLLAVAAALAVIAAVAP